jgi:hypothetical protein
MEKIAFFYDGKFVNCIQEYFSRPFLRFNLPRLWEPRRAMTRSVSARLGRFQRASALRAQARTDLVSFSAPRLLGWLTRKTVGSYARFVRFLLQRLFFKCRTKRE